MQTVQVAPNQFRSSHNRAKKVNVDQAAREALETNLDLPQLTVDGRYNTMNGHGAMFPTLTPNQRAFLERASQPGASVLEIGPAYGQVCLEALKLGARDYVVVEMDEQHLKILARRVPIEKRQHLSMIQGAFPSQEVIEGLGSIRKFDAIQADLVFHFLPGSQMVQKAFDTVYSLLKPSGRFYTSFITPYCKFMKESFRQNFDEQVDAFIKGLTKEAPGFIPKPREFADEIEFQKHGLSMDGVGMPLEHAFYFHIETAWHFLRTAGFKILEIKYVSLEQKVYGTTGKEILSIVAEKP